MSGMTTKEKILAAALDLFSEKGYDGVGIDLIAETVGIKGPSIYKHFSGKEAILNALMDRVDEYYSANFGSEGNPGKIPSSIDELVELSRGRINFTMHDPMIQKVRKILVNEQFRSDRIADICSKHSFYGLVSMYKLILSVMAKNGIVNAEDTEMMAVEIVTPISIFIQIYDRQPQKEKEVMNLINGYLAYFQKKYGGK